MLWNIKVSPLTGDTRTPPPRHGTLDQLAIEGVIAGRICLPPRHHVVWPCMGFNAPSFPARAVSVITRTRDRPRLLSRARASIASQTFGDLAWVIVNDGGEPGPVEAEAEAARAAGIQAVAIHRQHSSGIEAAANAGIRASSSRYIVIHDDDDSWNPPFLALTVAALEQETAFVGVVTHSTTVVEQILGDTIVTISRKPQNRSLQVVYLADLVINNLFPPISFLFRRQIYDAVGGYNEEFPVLGDWEFNLKVAMQGDIRVLPKMLANYHVRMGAQDPTSRYANSIFAERDLHRLQDAVFRNRMLRADIAAGKVGIGMLLALARLQYRRRPTRALQLPQRRQRAFSGILSAVERLLAAPYRTRKP